jgi:hypothetical protein
VRENGLARSGFAGEAQRLSPRKAEPHAIHRAAARELRREVTDVEKRLIRRLPGHGTPSLEGR